MSAGSVDFAQGGDDLFGDRKTCLAPSCFHLCEDFLRDGDARDLVIQIVRHLEAFQRDDAEEDGKIQVFGAGEEVFCLPDIIDWLGLDELSSRFFLALQPFDLCIEVIGAGISCGTDVEIGSRTKVVSFDIVTAVEAAGDLDQSGGVDFEDTLGIRMVTDLGRIPGEGENVMYAKCCCSQKFRLRPMTFLSRQVRWKMDSTWYFCWMMQERAIGLIRILPWGSRRY